MKDGFDTSKKIAVVVITVNRPGWVAQNKTARWNILQHHRTRPNSGTIANTNRAQNTGVRSYPDMATDYRPEGFSRFRFQYHLLLDGTVWT